MRRREFITLVCSAATWPFAARAQQATKTYHIALVHPSLSVADMNETSKGNPSYTVLFKELRRLGYTEGGNLVVTRYSGEGREERYPELCHEVVRTNPDIIVTNTSRLVLGFKRATDTIPVVAVMADPVPFGIVASIARPGGNITGVSVEAGPDIWGKRLQVLREARMSGRSKRCFTILLKRQFHRSAVRRGEFDRDMWCRTTRHRLHLSGCARALKFAGSRVPLWQGRGRECRRMRTRPRSYMALSGNCNDRIESPLLNA